MTILIKVAGLHIARHVVIWYYGGNRVCDTRRRMDCTTKYAEFYVSLQ